MRFWTPSLLCSCLLLGACGDDAPVTPDASAGQDSGAPTDAAIARDGGRLEDDAALPEEDAATPPADAGPQTLSERYPGDEGIGDDPAVLFHDDFEGGWGRWDAPSADTRYLHLEDDGSIAQSGSRYLRSTVTGDDLNENMYISSQARVSFERVDEVWWRFYARFPHVAPNPHHWVRMAAGTEDWNGSGLANNVPPGDQGFWFDFDINNRDQFNFYAYWHRMRSGRCNDGSATPGCEGDQGTTYHYGNTFQPPEQMPFARDEWICIEIHASANAPGTNGGSLAFSIDGEEVGAFGPGYPEGTWLRDRFHPGGCEFSACAEPTPYEGFDFRTSEDVRFKTIVLDAYYQRNTFERKRQALRDMGLDPSDTQTILYDDVVVATERIGCQR